MPSNPNFSHCWFLLLALFLLFALPPPLPAQDEPEPKRIYRASFESMRLVDVSWELSQHFGRYVVALPGVATRTVKRVESSRLDDALSQLARQLNTEWWVQEGIYYIGSSQELEINMLRLRGLKGELTSLVGSAPVSVGDSVLYRGSARDRAALELAYRKLSERAVLPVRLVVLSTDDSDASRIGFDPRVGVAIQYTADWNNVVDEVNDLLKVGVNINTALDLSLQMGVVEVEVDTHALLVSGENFEIEVADVFQREVSERTGDTNSPVFRTGFIETKVGLKIQLVATFISDEMGWQVVYSVSDADGNQDQENRVASKGMTVLPSQAAMRSIVTLKRTRLQEIENSIPYLRRIPLLGELFRRKNLLRRTRNVGVLLASSGAMPLTMSPRTLEPALLPPREFGDPADTLSFRPEMAPLSQRGALFGSEPFVPRALPPAPPEPAPVKLPTFKEIIDSPEGSPGMPRTSLVEPDMVPTPPTAPESMLILPETAPAPASAVPTQPPAAPEPHGPPSVSFDPFLPLPPPAPPQTRNEIGR